MQYYILKPNDPYLIYGNKRDILKHLKEIKEEDKEVKTEGKLTLWWLLYIIILSGEATD
jgi:hypothetical protein